MSDMNEFQILTIVPLGLLALWELAGLIRRHERRPLRVVRLITWLAAAIAIANPELVTRVANATGIGRGSNLVLYLFVIFSLLSAFYFYARQLVLQRQITEVIRHLAIHEARHGNNASTTITRDDSTPDGPGESP